MNYLIMCDKNVIFNSISFLLHKNRSKEIRAKTVITF